MKLKTKTLCLTALMAAVLCIVAPLSIPIGDVPISLATFGVYLCGILLGEKLGTAAVGIYVLLGLVGVPVFAGWKAGVAILAGPTGGFLIGYIFQAAFTGIFAYRCKGKRLIMLLGMLIGTVVCYVIGVTWLGCSLHLSVKAALMAGLVPFIPGDACKMLACLAIGPQLQSQLRRLVNE